MSCFILGWPCRNCHGYRASTQRGSVLHVRYLHRLSGHCWILALEEPLFGYPAVWGDLFDCSLWVVSRSFSGTSMHQQLSRGYLGWANSLIRRKQTLEGYFLAAGVITAPSSFLPGFAKPLSPNTNGWLNKRDPLKACDPQWPENKRSNVRAFYVKLFLDAPFDCLWRATLFLGHLRLRLAISDALFNCLRRAVDFLGTFMREQCVWLVRMTSLTVCEVTQ